MVIPPSGGGASVTGPTLTPDLVTALSGERLPDREALDDLELLAPAAPRLLLRPGESERLTVLGRRAWASSDPRARAASADALASTRNEERTSFMSDRPCRSVAMPQGMPVGCRRALACLRRSVLP
jgi:hypothetical protein